VSAYLATREYGQRLAHALDTYEAQETAGYRAAAWTWSAGMLPEILPPGPGAIVGVAAEVGAVAFRADGTWVDPPDTGLVFDADLAVEEASGEVGRVPAVDRAVLAVQVRDAFARTAAALGEPVPVLSPHQDLQGAVLDGLLPEAGGRRRAGAPGVIPRPLG
jgi:hypothetical protein